MPDAAIRPPLPGPSALDGAAALGAAMEAGAVLLALEQTEQDP